MQTYTIIFGVLLCLAASNARKFERRDIDSEVEDHVDTARRPREHSPIQRHKRRSWQNDYGYAYPQPPNPMYQDRRDYDQQNHQDPMPQIWRLLDEISSYVRRPPVSPPPQPVYIPYAVPYPIAQSCNCVTPTGAKEGVNLTFGNRFKDMEPEQDWGPADSNGNYDDGDDGSRPISFAPVMPKRPLKRPSMQVEHGSTQSGFGGGTSAVSSASYLVKFFVFVCLVYSYNAQHRLS